MIGDTLVAMEYAIDCCSGVITEFLPATVIGDFLQHHLTEGQ